MLISNKLNTTSNKVNVIAQIIPHIIIDTKLPYKKINKLYSQEDSSVVGIVINVRIDIFFIIGKDK